jgi:DNA-binding response OmpR family regulator
LLFERKKIAKDFLLESVLNLRKDTKTKTLESHLTRIRKKLICINSEIEIILKENTVFLIT